LCGSSCIKCRRASGGNLGFDPRPAKLADRRRRRREAVRANGPNPSPWGRHLIQGPFRAHRLQFVPTRKVTHLPGTGLRLAPVDRSRHQRYQDLRRRTLCLSRPCLIFRKTSSESPKV
jgi:hypothetical protein